MYFAHGAMKFFQFWLAYSFWLLIKIFSVTQGYAQIEPAPKLAKPFSGDAIQQAIIYTSDSTKFISWAKGHDKTLSITRLSENIYQAKWNHSLISNQLKEIPGARFIDRVRHAREETILGNFDFTLNSVTAAHAQYPAKRGAGIVLSVKEKPFSTTDLDLKGRVKPSIHFDEPATLHATFMATIAAGGGNTIPAAKGAAWGAQVTTSDFDRLLPDLASELQTLQISVQNHSYGVGLENYYGIESAEYDRSVINNSKLVHVFSSGNEGQSTSLEGSYAGIEGVANLTGQFKVAKNVMTVGSTDKTGQVVPLSSRGPAHDGRIKPELVAFGDAGSSESAALVSGVVALAQEHFASLHGELPDAALVKAILINTAFDTGRPNPDFEAGFGQVNALGVMRAISSNQFFTSEIQQNEEQTFIIPVPANQTELRITLAWNDQPAEPFSEKALVQDLDLRLRHPDSGGEWLPWVLNPSASLSALQEPAQRGVDRLNPVEQITLNQPEPGTYEIKVKGHDLAEGSQTFFVVYEFRNGFEWTFPLTGNGLVANQEQLIRWSWSGADLPGTLSYRFSSQSEWSELESALPLNQQYYNWNVPDTAALVQFRMGIDGQYYETDLVMVSRPERLRVGFVCPDEVMLVWTPVENATSYSVMSMGNFYLEPLKTVTDTFTIVTRNENSFYSVAPMLDGRLGTRESTIDYTQQGVGCYLISFRAQQYLVNDAAYFECRVGTIFQLSSVVLERLQSGTYVPIETVTPTSTQFLLTDPAPPVGLSRYRARLITQSNGEVTSQDESIFLVKDDQLVVYPNPLARSEVLNILIDTEETAIIRIFDLHGRLIRGVKDTGVTKTIDVSDFKAGTYLLRVYKNDGQILTTRLAIL